MTPPHPPNPIVRPQLLCVPVPLTAPRARAECTGPHAPAPGPGPIVESAGWKVLAKVGAASGALLMERVAGQVGAGSGALS